MSLWAVIWRLLRIRISQAWREFQVGNMLLLLFWWNITFYLSFYDTIRQFWYKSDAPHRILEFISNFVPVQMHLPILWKTEKDKNPVVLSGSVKYENNWQRGYHYFPLEKKNRAFQWHQVCCPGVNSFFSKIFWKPPIFRKRATVFRTARVKRVTGWKS